MMNNVLGLYDHNMDSYKKVRGAYQNGEKVVGIIHATGTGKTLIALQLAYDNKKKKILYLTPYNSIIEHIREVINDNPMVSLEKDFSHVQFMTYSNLVKMSKKELEELDVDLLILDEFHHIGAPVWGDRINTIRDSHADLEIFGMSAYSVRDRGTAYERDLAESNSDELFSDKIVSRYDLIDAMLDGVLPVPNYKGVYFFLNDLLKRLEKKIDGKYSIDSKEYENYIKVLHDLKRRISECPAITDVIKKNIKPGDKFIYFCPPVSEDGVNDVDTIMINMKKMFLELGYKEEDLLFYKTTSYDSEMGKLNRNAFYNDIDLDGVSASKKLRIMFTINQYNEGVHAPNIDGVFLGRETESDIIFFEQMGRALSVRGDTKSKIDDLKKYSYDELVKMCIYRSIKINKEMTKDDLIERLVSPLVIDMVGNFTFIRDLITELKHRIRELKKNDMEKVKRFIDLTEHSFDVEIIGQDILEILLDMKEEFLPKNFYDCYFLAKKYYEHYGNLNIVRSFKTEDGINPSSFGYALGDWIAEMRRRYKNNFLSPEKIEMLNEIGMIWSIKKTWDEVYLYAYEYYLENGNLNVSSSYVTLDGYNLGMWVALQRSKKEKFIV